MVPGSREIEMPVPVGVGLVPPAFESRSLLLEGWNLVNAFAEVEVLEDNNPLGDLTMTGELAVASGSTSSVVDRSVVGTQGPGYGGPGSYPFPLLSSAVMVPAPFPSGGAFRSAAVGRTARFILTVATQGAGRVIRIRVNATLIAGPRL